MEKDYFVWGLNGDYFHITAPENVSAILKEGLKANADGEIFLFEIATFPTIIAGKDLQPIQVVESVENHIAKNQIFLERYAVLGIDADGINGELEADNVAELCAKYQYIARQDIIKPEFITLIGEYDTDFFMTD